MALSDLLRGSAQSDRGAGAFLVERHRFKPVEAIPWVVAVGVYFVFPGYLHLGSQVLIMVLFALSLDLILGYAGVISLGHAAMFGAGAYASGILAAHLGWSEPITGLVFAGLVAAGVGFVSGWFLLRTRGLTLLMLTLSVAVLLQEFANEQEKITGGADGLRGIKLAPILGAFKFDLFGQTAYLYTLAVLFIFFLFSRALVYSPFGQALCGIRENVRRMHAIGTPVHGKLVAIYTISAALAGVAGALQAQTNNFVSLEVLGFQLSGDVVVVLILGGFGRLYGAFIGAPIYMVLQDQLAKLSPAYWLAGVGLALVLTVLFAPRGLLGLVEDFGRKVAGGWR
jgi:branched-chain amino acid transport system permease protein